MSEKLKEISKEFENSEIKHGDLGDYIEIYIHAHVYVHFFDNPGLTTQLLFNDKFVSFLFGVKTIEDLKKIYKLFTNVNT